MFRFVLLIALVSCAPAWASSTFDDGMTAFEEANAAKDPNHEGYARAYQIWSPLAERGDSASQYHLGVLYFYGLGGARFDQYEAVKLFRESADGGYPLAQAFMGFLSENGDNVVVSRNEDRALAWYRKAAESDQCIALRRLERAYRAGELGLTEDGAKADEYLARQSSCRPR